MSFQIASDYPALLLFTTLIGFAVLIMGRHILWVFLSGLGFTLGLVLSSQFYNFRYEWQIILISLLIGLLGALLGYTVQRLAAGIAGFATGWYLTIVLLSYFNLNSIQYEQVIPIIIGIISGVLLMMFYDWGVIIASSLAGSAIIISGMSITQNAELALLVMFAFLGMSIQTIWFLQEK
ncbi:DUF4203 domain-containing protein [Chloroflexota bacterium]